MRDFKGMKRQRGRNRGGGSSGGKPQQHNANRAFDSNGPDGVKVRGNAQHVFEKYQQLARDANAAGDRVLLLAGSANRDERQFAAGDEGNPRGAGGR